MSFQYGVKIFVITSYKDTCYIEILPETQRSERGKIFLSVFVKARGRENDDIFC